MTLDRMIDLQLINDLIIDLISQYVTRPTNLHDVCRWYAGLCGSDTWFPLPIIIYRVGPATYYTDVRPPHTGPLLDPGKHWPDLRSGRKPKRAATSGESLQEEAAPPHHVDCQMHEVWQEMCGDEGYCAMHIQCTTALVYNFRALAIIWWSRLHEAQAVSCPGLTDGNEFLHHLLLFGEHKTQQPASRQQAVRQEIGPILTPHSWPRSVLWRQIRPAAWVWFLLTFCASDASSGLMDTLGKHAPSWGGHSGAMAWHRLACYGVNSFIRVNYYDLCSNICEQQEHAFQVCFGREHEPNCSPHPHQWLARCSASTLLKPSKAPPSPTHLFKSAWLQQITAAVCS